MRRGENRERDPAGGSQPEPGPGGKVSFSKLKHSECFTFRCLFVPFYQVRKRHSIKSKEMVEQLVGSTPTDVNNDPFTAKRTEAQRWVVTCLRPQGSLQ